MFRVINNKTVFKSLTNLAFLPAFIFLLDEKFIIHKYLYINFIVASFIHHIHTENYFWSKKLYNYDIASQVALYIIYITDSLPISIFLGICTIFLNELVILFYVVMCCIVCRYLNVVNVICYF